MLVDKVSSKYQCFLYTKVTLRRSLNLSSPNAPKVQPDRGNESIVPLWTSNLAAREVPVVCGKIWGKMVKGGYWDSLCQYGGCYGFYVLVQCFILAFDVFSGGGSGDYFLLTFTSLGLFGASDFM